MSYRSGILLAILLHGIILLCLTEAYWPMQKPAGWQNAKIVQSYLFSPKRITGLNRSNPRHQLKSNEPKQIQVTHRASAIKVVTARQQKSTQNNSATTENLSQGQYNQLLVLLHNAIASKQIYPANAAMLGQHGNVALSFILQSSGVISTITIKKSSGFSLLDNAAVAAVQAISPFTQMQIAHTTNLTIQIQFSG